MTSTGTDREGKTCTIGSLVELVRGQLHAAGIDSADQEAFGSLSMQRVYPDCSRWSIEIGWSPSMNSPW